LKPLRIYSKVDRFYKVFVTVFSLFFIGLNIHVLNLQGYEINAQYLIFFLISILLILLFILLPKITYFEFGENELICKTLFFVSKSIPYNNIKKLEKSKSLYSGLKFSTSLKGIILSYEKYDDILISPEDLTLFVNELKKRNSSIIIEI
jgi:hypothetical protein